MTRESLEVLGNLCCSEDILLRIMEGGLLSNDCRSEAEELPMEEEELVSDRESKENVLLLALVIELAIECRRGRVAELEESGSSRGPCNDVTSSTSCSFESTATSVSAEDRSIMNCGCWLTAARNVSLAEN